jgi:hypothetical protein
MAPLSTTRRPSSSITVAHDRVLLAVVARLSNSHCGTPPVHSSHRIFTSDRVLANTMYAKWAIIAYAIKVAHANVPNIPDFVPDLEPDLGDQPTSTIYPPIPSVSMTTQVTSVASPTASLGAILPSQVPLPPLQAWCPSKIFCPGAVSHVFLPFLVFDARMSTRSCKPSTSLTFGRTRKFSSTNPRSQIRSLSWLRLRP